MTQDQQPPLDPNPGVGTFSPTFMYGMTMSEVEVDPATGKTTILRTTTVADVGVVGNRLSVEGQAYGGFSHCVGYALSENYDPLRKNNGMVQCGIPTVNDVPDDLNVLFVENPRSKGPHGSCGAAEVFQSSGHMSIINGIADATGVRIKDLPATPEKVKKGMELQAQGKEEPDEKYFLGSDFEEEMEEIAENPVHLG
jgi:aldehyde oxidoreductase